MIFDLIDENAYDEATTILDHISSGDDTVAASLSPCLFSLAGVSKCLALSTIPVQFNKKNIYAILDSGASIITSA